MLPGSAEAEGDADGTVISSIKASSSLPSRLVSRLAHLSSSGSNIGLHPWRMEGTRAVVLTYHSDMLREQAYRSGHGNCAYYDYGRRDCCVSSALVIISRGSDRVHGVY
jgi:hypothetical protein